MTCQARDLCAALPGCSLRQGGDAKTWGCLVAVGAYFVIISLAFVMVTILYATSSSDCKTTANHAKNIKELVHYNIFAVDNSKNGGETVEKGSVDEEGKSTTIVCNCGEKAVLTVFEVIVLIAIAVFLVYVACGVTGHFCAVFLNIKQASLLKKDKAAQQGENRAAETGSCGASRASAGHYFLLISNTDL